jgi:oxygen-independent coproporphyrinogen-3 oxidase
MLGLYIHIPFCSAICNYCNFNRGLFDAVLKERYLDALTTEIATHGRGETEREADTVYFGGGTPSLLESDEIARIVDTAAEAFELAPDCEVTLEANPESVTGERLAAYRKAGVNRLSFGVQSFRPDELRRLSRLHDADRARSAVNDARGAGFDNISLDLMMWLPEQRVADWLESVDQAIALGPDHLSLYMLEIYPNAPLKDEMARARWSQAPDDDVAAMYTTAFERLEASGGPMASGSGSAAARTRRGTAFGGRMSHRRKTTSRGWRRVIRLWRTCVTSPARNASAMRCLLACV